jgi:pimeloyl-ACP methyl ester carboxylesterase
MNKTLFLILLAFGLCGVSQSSTIHVIKTSDGTSLRILELDSEHAARPILMVHGYQSNWSTWKILAEKFRSKGYRVFLLNLRGHDKEMVASNRSSIMTFHKMVTEDFPTAVGFVFRQSQNQKVSVIGHSLGGMIAPLAMAGVSESAGRYEISSERRNFFADRVASFVALDSPIIINPVDATPIKALTSELAFTALYKKLNNGKLDRFLMKLLYSYSRRLKSLKGFINVPNLSQDELSGIFESGFSQVPKELQDDMGQMRKSGYASPDHLIDYSEVVHGCVPSIKTMYVRAETSVITDADSMKGLTDRCGYEFFNVPSAGHVDVVYGGKVVEEYESELMKFIEETKI